MSKKLLIAAAIFSFIFANSASAAILPNFDIASPDSPFYFLQTWKESIQTFFTFGLENKAKQYLHLAEVRLNEYQKMVEKGKTEIAEKTLSKYEDQLNRALTKAQELKDQGKNIDDLFQKIKQATSNHLEVLQENLQKVPEQAKKGLENAIENSQKEIEKISKKNFCVEEGKMCGGIAGILCCSGLECQIQGNSPLKVKGNYPDASGTCIKEGEKACTQEAKQCSNGSYVSRTGPNCEFAACPEAKKNETAGWKTYNKYGFSVKHPPFLKALENPAMPEAYLYSVSFENPLADQTTAGQKIVFNVSVFKDNKQLQDAFKLLTLDDKGKVMFGGYEAQKLFSPKGRAVSFTEATIYTIAAKNTALIFYGADFSGVSQTDMNKILASFKFAK